jgi:Rod binding domain-containing protein
MGTVGGLGSLTAQTGLLQAQQDRMLQQAQAEKSSNQDAKIEKSSKEFESMLLSTWLQQAEQSFATVPGADDDDDAGRSQMMSLGVQTLATSMADSGGIGIGKMIAKALHAQADKAAAHTGAAVPASPKQAVEGR